MKRFFGKKPPTILRGNAVLRYDLQAVPQRYVLEAADIELSEEIRASLLSQALPQGRGWARPDFSGSRFFRIVPVNDNIYGMVSGKILEATDAHGRGGLCEAEIYIGDRDDVTAWIGEKKEEYRKSGALAEVSRRISQLGGVDYAALVARNLWHSRFEARFVVTHPYSKTDWVLVEACIFLFTSNEAWMHKYADAQHTCRCATLALGLRDEMPLLGIPSDVVEKAGIPALNLSKLPTEQVWM